MLLAASHGTDQVLGEGDAHHVVQALVEDGYPAVAGLDGSFEDRPGLGRLLYGDDVGTRHHHLADDRVAELDDRVDEHPLVALDRLVQDRHVREGQQLGLGDVGIGLGALRTRVLSAGRAR